MDSAAINKRFREIDNDISADILLADVVEGNVLRNIILTKNLGAFRRDYATDFAQANSTKVLDEEFIELQLNRDSLYNRLPEGVFHSFQKEASNYTSPADMIGNYHKNRQEEKDAKQFFQPFEHEFILYSARFKNQFQKWLFQIENEFFDIIWELDQKIPFRYLVKLFSVAPYSHSLVGKKDIVANILSKILDVDVSIKTKAATEVAQIVKDNDQWTLGVTSLIGETVAIQKNIWDISVGPIAENLEDYTLHGMKRNFIRYFFDYFLPLGIDVEFTVIPSLDTPRNILGHEVNTVLGEILEI